MSCTMLLCTFVPWLLLCATAHWRFRRANERSSEGFQPAALVCGRLHSLGRARPRRREAMMSAWLLKSPSFFGKDELP